jgi:hypothetical protein
LRNTLYYGDNLQVLRDYIPAQSVDLVYVDPPFNSNASYNVLFKEKTGEESPARLCLPLSTFTDNVDYFPTGEAEVYRFNVHRRPCGWLGSQHVHPAVSAANFYRTVTMGSVQQGCQVLPSFRIRIDFHDSISKTCTPISGAVSVSLKSKVRSGERIFSAQANTYAS